MYTKQTTNTNLEQRIECKLEGLCPTVKPSIISSPTPCSGGSAAGYSCDNIDLLAFVSLSDLGSQSNADGYVSTSIYIYDQLLLEWKKWLLFRSSYPLSRRVLSVGPNEQTQQSPYNNAVR